MKQTNEAEIIDLTQVPRPKVNGKGPGGYDYFVNMEVGTVFCVKNVFDTGSLLAEYMLCQKNGVTVLLQTADTSQLVRHLGDNFCAQNNLVQILHLPEKKDNENGTGPTV